MINDVREAFKRNLKNLKWMDDETREAAMVKADAISDMIGFPDFILNPSQLDRKYEKLEVKVVSLHKNIHIKFETSKILGAKQRIFPEQHQIE